MFNLKQVHKKRLFGLYFKQLILFVFGTLFFSIGVHAEPSIEAPATYNITLPQKVEGIQKLEYSMDQKNMGNTAGTKSIDVAPNTVLDFLVQVEPENYSKLHVKDVKIRSQSGQTLGLMKYMYNKNGEFTKVQIPENDFIDPKQTYVTSDYKINYNDVLSLDELKKDTFNTHISTTNNEYSLNEALDISYKLDKDNQNQTPVYNKNENRFEIDNVTANTPITLTINKNKEFSQSDIEVFNGENKIILADDGSTSVPAIKSDINIIIKNINKNKYNLSFENYEDALFECRKQGEETFSAVSAQSLSITSGESYEFKCLPKSNDVLDNKEVTANNIAIQNIDGIYKLQNITEDIKLAIQPKEESSYKINLPDENSGVTVTDESGEKIYFAKAKFEESFKFKLSANKGYEQNIASALVYAVPTSKLENNGYDISKNSEEALAYQLTPSYSDVYTISKVKEPTSIVVKNLIKDTYKLTFPENPEGISYKVELSEGVNQVSENVFTAIHGSKVFVTLTADEGKNIDSDTFGTNDPDVLITRNGNNYTLENITQDTKIIIYKLEDKKCSVTFDSSGIVCEDEKGYALNRNTLKVDYKGSAKFKVEPEKGYSAKNGINLKIKTGNATLKKLSDENLFEISNVTEDTQISVNGVEKETLTVRLASAEDTSVVFKSTDGQNLPAENKITYGEDLEFEVSSKNSSNQEFNITSSNPDTNIEALDNTTNRFVLRNAASNTTLSASPVYASNNDIELAGANHDAYTTAKNNTINRGTNAKTNNDTISLTETMTFTINNTTMTLNQALEHYEIYYTLDINKNVDEDDGWINMRDNPTLKTNDSDLYVEVSDSGCIFYYRPKLKIKPKIADKCITNMQLKLTTILTDEHDTISTIDDAFDDSTDVLMDAFTPGVRNYKSTYYVGGAIRKSSNGIQYQQYLGNHSGWTEGILDLRFGAGKTTGTNQTSPTILSSTANFIFTEEERFSVQLFNYRTYKPTGYNSIPNMYLLPNKLSARPASELTFTLTDMNDSSNNITITKSDTPPVNPWWNLSATQVSFKNIGNNLESNFKMEFTVKNNTTATPTIDSLDLIHNYFYQNISVGADSTPQKSNIFDSSTDYSQDLTLHDVLARNYYATENYSTATPYHKMNITYSNRTLTASDDGKALTLSINVMCTCTASYGAVYIMYPYNSPMPGALYDAFSNFQNTDRNELEYTVKPIYTSATVKFESDYNNSTYFTNTSSQLFDNNTATVPAEKNLDFYLCVDEKYRFTALNDDDAKKVIQISPANDDTNLSVIYSYTARISGDKIYYTLKNVANTEGTPQQLNISVNMNYIEELNYKGVFASGYLDHSKYEDEYGNPLYGHTFKHGDDFTLYTSPDETGEAGIPDLAITIGSNVIECNKPSEDSPQATTEIAGKLTVALSISEDKVKINLYGVKTDFTLTATYDWKTIPITFNADDTFRYKCLSPATLANEHDGIVPTDEHALAETKEIKYNQSLSFIVVANEGQSLDDIEVTSNGQTINMSNGKYTVSHVSTSQDIRVRGVTTAKSTVTFTKYDDIFFKNLNNELYAEQTPVEYAHDITFKVTTSSAYTQNADAIEVRAEYASGDDSQLTYDPSTHAYTIQNITENIRVYVKNMKLNEYTITLKPLEGIEYFNEYGTGDPISGAQTVNHGDNFSFKVKAKTGYNISNLKIYDKPASSNNSNQLLSSQDVYTISNITENHTVTAQDVPKTKCKIELRALNGSSFTDSSGNTINTNVEVDYGSDYKFNLSLDTAYNKSQPRVKIKGSSAELPKNSDGSYTIQNIKEDKIVEIENVTKNTYTATFKPAEGVVYRTAKNKPFTGTQPVEYEGTLYFKISLMDAYDKSTPLVLLDDKKVLGENSGVYSISNIHDDVVVTVKNVVKNPEEVSIAEILDVPTEINTDDDVNAVVNATNTYMNLSDEDKEQVTNVDDLKKAQENAGRLNHNAENVQIAGVDWNIKLVVTPLNDDPEQMKAFQEKVDRRSLLSLYDIHLVDLLTGKDFEVPYGQKVSVILPVPDLTGCAKPVVAHETSAGSMEYLDINIVDERAQFETSSFSKFGIAAKRLENYVDNPSNMKISVGSLVDNEEELKSLLGEGLVSQLGNLLDQSDEEDDNATAQNDDSIETESSTADILGLKKIFSDAGLENSYNWILEHELIAVISILLLGSLLIWLLLALARKKKKEEEEKSKNKK